MSTSSARKKNQLDPIKPSDTPDQVNAKLKIINELLSNTDSDTINKEEKKQYLFLLENLSQKEIENILGPHPEYKALLCCCFIELIRILSTDNELVGKKAEFMFRMIIDTVKNAKTVLEKNARNQLVYLLHQLEKTRACKIFITDNYTELGKTFIQYLLGNETELVQYPDIFYQTQKLLISIFEVSFNFVSDDNLQYILLPILLSLQKELSKSKQFELSKNTIKELSWGARNLCGKLCIDLFKKKDVYRKVQIEQEHILSIIYYLFKIDYDIIRGIWPYLESETNFLLKKNKRKAIWF